MRFRTSLLAAAVVAVATLACSPPTAEDLVQEVIDARNQFEVQLSSWLDRQEPGGPHIYLDMRLVKNVDNDLDDLTVMAEQLDADGDVLSQQRVTLEVGDMTRGLARNVNAELRPIAEGVEGVRVYIEQSPPREAWEEFPEFDAVRPRG